MKIKISSIICNIHDFKYFEISTKNNILGRMYSNGEFDCGDASIKECDIDVKCIVKKEDPISVPFYIVENKCFECGKEATKRMMVMIGIMPEEQDGYMSYKGMPGAQEFYFCDKHSIELQNVNLKITELGQGK